MAWLSGWSYRKEITVTGETGAGTNYQVILDIGDASGGDFHLEGNCTNFPEDIEVTDNDGETLLKFWIPDKTADPLEMWVKVADDLGSNQTIYIYYGKSGATTNSSGANTFIQYHGTATTDYQDSAICGPDDIAYETSVKATGTLANAYLLTGIGVNVPAGDEGGDQLRAIQYNPGDDTYYSSWNNGTQTYFVNAPAITDGAFHHYKITFDGSTATYYRDGVSKGTNNTNLPNEAMGLRFTVKAGAGEQDWSFVRKYNSPEPAFSSAGSEETSVTQATTLLHGKIRIKDSTTNLADGKVQIQDTATSLIDGLVKVQDKATGLTDGLLIVQDKATGLIDGKVQVQDIATDLVDGKVIVSLVSAGTDQADGKIQIKNVTIGMVDGLLQIPSRYLFDVSSEQQHNIIYSSEPQHNINIINSLYGVYMTCDQVIDSYDVYDTWYPISSGVRYGQAFLMGDTNRTLCLAKFFINSGFSSPYDVDLAAELYACTGAPGTDGVMTGSALAVSDSVNITSSYNDWPEFIFSTPYELVANTSYCIALHPVVTSGSWSFMTDQTSPTHPGNMFEDTTPEAGTDAGFYIYYSLPKEHLISIINDEVQHTIEIITDEE